MTTLTSLQRLARKHRARLSFSYCSGEGYWWGVFGLGDNEIVIRDTNFTKMLQKLHYEVKKENNYAKAREC